MERAMAKINKPVIMFKDVNYRSVECCGTCKHGTGPLEWMGCSKLWPDNPDYDIQPYKTCDEYEKGEAWDD